MRPSRTWRALAACTLAQPVPPWSIDMYPAGACAIEPMSPQDAQGIDDEVADAASRAEEPVEGMRHPFDQFVVGAAPIHGAHYAGVEVLEQ